MVKQGAKFSGLALIQVFLDVGAAYGAFVGGNFLGEAVPQYGFGAVALQAIAYFLSGYYFIGGGRRWPAGSQTRGYNLQAVCMCVWCVCVHCVALPGRCVPCATRWLYRRAGPPPCLRRLPACLQPSWTSSGWVWCSLPSSSST